MARTVKRSQAEINNAKLMDMLNQQETERNIKAFHKCTYCGMTTNTDVSKFPSVYSNLYKGNDYRLPICKDCLDKLYNEVYYPKYLDQSKAIRRICQIYDIYFNDEIVTTSVITARPTHLMTQYAQKAMLQQYANKTYDDTIAEEAKADSVIVDYTKLEKGAIPEETVKFWGFGFSEEDYAYLDERYATWSACYDINTESMSTIFRNICIRVNTTIYKLLIYSALTQKCVLNNPLNC